MSCQKRLRLTEQPDSDPDLLSDLPDDLVLLVLSKLSSSSASPSDFLTVLLTCKRMNKLGTNSSVLKELNCSAMSPPARNWSENSHRFLRRCVNSGNVEAHYLLGMIRFYCLEIRPSGTALMAKAAMKHHAPSLFSLAVIHFNGSGRSKAKKDLPSGVALCARAAFLGSIDALRELGHCLLDGYGVESDFVRGRRLILQAGLRELQLIKRSDTYSLSSIHHPDPAHRFLREWFESRQSSGGEKSEMELCSNEICGRVETRVNEFRRCSDCSGVRYCSRSCQAVHWRSGHKDECVLPEPVEEEEEDGDADVDDEGGPEEDEEGNVDFNGGINVVGSVLG